MSLSIHLVWSSCFLLSSSLFPPVAALRLAQAVPQYLDARQDFLGGWAMGLPGTTCPSDVPVQCKGSISNPACCPTGTFCDGLGEEYCCPTDVDCKSTVTNFPKCAVATHTLYVLTSSTYFCCPPGQFGVLPISLYGGFCQPDGSVIAASRIASKATDGLPQQTIGLSTTSVGTAANGGATSGSKTTTSRASGTQTSNNQGSSTGVPSGSDNNNNNNNKSSSSLGAGPIAGIVIGALGVLALFLLAFLLFRRSKPNRQAPTGVLGPQSPAPDYRAYAPPTHQDMRNYPTPIKSATISHAGVSTAVGSSPGVTPLQGDGYGNYIGPPPPAAGYSEVQGQNTWDGRAEMGETRYHAAGK